MLAEIEAGHHENNLQHQHERKHNNTNGNADLGLQRSLQEIVHAEAHGERGHHSAQRILCAVHGVAQRLTDVERLVLLLQSLHKRLVVALRLALLQILDALLVLLGGFLRMTRASHPHLFHLAYTKVRALQQGMEGRTAL